MADLVAACAYSLLIHFGVSGTRLRDALTVRSRAARTARTGGATPTPGRRFGVECIRASSEPSIRMHIRHRSSPRDRRARKRTVGLAPVALSTAFLLVCTAARDVAADGGALTRQQVMAALEKTRAGERPDLSARTLAGLDLSGVDFKGANLSASVFNGAHLRQANLARCNLTVAFGENADFRGADLRGAQMFSMQLQSADLSGANLTGARLIGDLTHARLDGAILERLQAGADMKNQSMGLMNARFESASLKHADLRNADLSLADLKFADLSGASLVGASLSGADLSGANLEGADLSHADLRRATLIDADFTSAKLTGARFDGATLRNTQGLADARRRGALGLP